VFRRRKDESAQPDAGPPDADSSDAESRADTPPVAVEPVFDRSGGPYDALDVPDDGVTRLDLGGLRVPAFEGMELRLDMDQASGQVVTVTVVAGESAVQLSAFAAPRLDGIWEDVRGDIAAGISSSGGTVDRVRGRLGDELRATLPADPGQRGGAMVPARFVGVDGPRWFLRGLFTGAAARDETAAAPLEAVLRGCVVVRGGDPMAPGDGLPLQVPTEIPDGLAAGDDSATAAGSPLAPPRRGPEITEIR
jgi:hypothetical protein